MTLHTVVAWTKRPPLVQMAPAVHRSSPAGNLFGVVVRMESRRQMEKTAPDASESLNSLVNTASLDVAPTGRRSPTGPMDSTAPSRRRQEV